MSQAAAYLRSQQGRDQRGTEEHQWKQRSSTPRTHQVTPVLQVSFVTNCWRVDSLLPFVRAHATRMIGVLEAHQLLHALNCLLVPATDADGRYAIKSQVSMLKPISVDPASFKELCNGGELIMRMLSSSDLLFLLVFTLAMNFLRAERRSAFFLRVGYFIKF